MCAKANQRRRAASLNLLGISHQPLSRSLCWIRDEFNLSFSSPHTVSPSLPQFLSVLPSPVLPRLPRPSPPPSFFITCSIHHSFSAFVSQPFPSLSPLALSLSLFFPFSSSFFFGLACNHLSPQSRLPSTTSLPSPSVPPSNLPPSSPHLPTLHHGSPFKLCHRFNIPQKNNKVPG